jgi:HAD superfamily hydrolase (TIGR01509 family)
MRTEGCIVDVDGTLLFSNDAHAESWTRVLCEEGHRVSFEEVRTRIGMGGDRILAELAGVDDDSDEGRFLKDRRRALFLAEYVDDLVPTPGARELLLRLRERGVRLVVGTSADDQELRALLRSAGVADCFDDVTTSSEVDASKPAPDVVEAALAKLDVHRARVLMIGDTPYDVAAAKRAGVRSVALRTGGWPDEALTDAIAIFDAPLDAVLALDRAPFFLAPRDEDRPSW